MTSRMQAEMAEQPELLGGRAGPLLVEARAAVDGMDRPELIVLAARGSSDHACLYARYLFEARLGIPVVLAAPSIVTRYHATVRYPRSLFVGVSQSGAAPDVAEILAGARAQHHRTLAITNADGGPVRDAADHHLALGAGPETAIAATKTFTLTLLAMYQLARALGAPLPAPGSTLAAGVAAMLDGPAVERARQLANAIASADLALSLGRGLQLSIAMEAALKLMECARVPCKAFSLADLAHGPMALAGEGAAAVVFDDRDPTSEAVRAKLEEAGVAVHDAPEVPELSEELRPIATAIFAQQVALEAALVRGLDPDRPPNLQKITRTR